MIRALATVMWLAAAPAIASPEARRFDRVSYTPAESWTVSQRGDELVQVSRIDGGAYCMVVIHASTPARGDLGESFAAEWRDVVLKTIDPVATPEVTLGNVGNTRAATGGAPATIKGQPAVAMLMVLEAGPSVVSVVILSSSTESLEHFTPDVQAMLAGLVVDLSGGAPAAAPAAGAAAPIPAGKLVIPPPSRPLTLADLAGDWQYEDRFSTTYVDRSTGAYAGSDHLAFRSSYTVTAKGAIAEHFFAIRNGKKIVDDQSGTIRISPDGRIIDVSIGSGPRYVVRGWLVMPAMTVLKLNGPHYGEIEERILADPAYGANIDMHWVRRPKTPAPK
jgi:hypothetical protein